MEAASIIVAIIIIKIKAWTLTLGVIIHSFFIYRFLIIIV